MNHYTVRTGTLVTNHKVIIKLLKTYVQYPPRELHSEGCPGQVTLTQYARFQYMRDRLKNDAVSIPLPTGN